jgi:hypothetical protein
MEVIFLAVATTPTLASIQFTLFENDVFHGKIKEYFYCSTTYTVFKPRGTAVFIINNIPNSSKLNCNFRFTLTSKFSKARFNLPGTTPVTSA